MWNYAKWTLKKDPCIRRTTIYHCDGFRYYSWVATHRQARRCSTLIPDGPPALFCRRWRTALSTSSSSVTKLSLGKCSRATEMICPYGGTLQYSSIILSVIRKIVTRAGRGGGGIQRRSTTLSAGSMPILWREDMKWEGTPHPPRLSPRGISDPSASLRTHSDPDPGWGTGTDGATITLSLTFQPVFRYPQISMSSVRVHWEAVCGLPASGRITTNPIGSTSVEGKGGTAGTALVSWSAPIERCLGDIKNHVKGMSCDGGPGWRKSGTDGGMFPVVSPSGTDTSSRCRTCTMSFRPSPRVCGEEVSARICTTAQRSQWPLLSPLCVCYPQVPPGPY